VRQKVAANKSFAVYLANIVEFQSKFYMCISRPIFTVYTHA